MQTGVQQFAWLLNKFRRKLLRKLQEGGENFSRFGWPFIFMALKTSWVVVLGRVGIRAEENEKKGRRPSGRPNKEELPCKFCKQR